MIRIGVLALVSPPLGSMAIIFGMLFSLLWILRNIPPEGPSKCFLVIAHVTIMASLLRFNSIQSPVGFNF
jgi:hypothetical protein